MAKFANIIISALTAFAPMEVIALKTITITRVIALAQPLMEEIAPTMHAILLLANTEALAFLARRLPPSHVNALTITMALNANTTISVLKMFVNMAVAALKWATITLAIALGQPTVDAIALALHAIRLLVKMQALVFPAAPPPPSLVNALTITLGLIVKPTMHVVHLLACMEPPVKTWT